MNQYTPQRNVQKHLKECHVKTYINFSTPILLKYVKYHKAEEPWGDLYTIPRVVPTLASGVLHTNRSIATFIYHGLFTLWGKDSQQTLLFLPCSG